MQILRDLVKKLSDLDGEISSLENQRVEKEQQASTLRERLIPDLMKSIGLKNLTTEDGLGVKIREEVRATQPKEGDPRRPLLFQYLERTNNSGLIKNKIVVQLPRDQNDLANRVVQAIEMLGGNIPIERKQELHHMTMLAFLREQLKQGVPVPLELFGAFVQTFAHVESKSAK